MPTTTAPQTAPPIGDGFDQPHEVTDIELAFPARVEHLMPTFDTIPEDFRRHHGNDWVDFVSTWFFRGFPRDRPVYLRPDVDSDKAMRHLRVILGSFEPKHEHKEAAVAWLMSRWFRGIGPKQDEATR